MTEQKPWELTEDGIAKAKFSAVSAPDWDASASLKRKWRDKAIADASQRTLLDWQKNYQKMAVVQILFDIQMTTGLNNREIMNIRALAGADVILALLNPLEEKTISDNKRIFGVELKQPLQRGE